MPELHFNILPEEQKKAWRQLTEQSGLLENLGFYLAGGTALALQLGHRQSIDFDFFSQKKNVAENVMAEFEQIPEFIVHERDANTIHGELGGVKISIIGGYKYDTITDLLKTEDGLYLGSIKEIGVMKLLAITHRATIRDYIDLAAILRGGEMLKELLELSCEKYGEKFNVMIPLRALSSFDDLAGELPKVFDKDLLNEWQSILKKAVEETAKSI